MPVTELSFPAITVCRQGLDMAAVQRAMELDYEDWVARRGPPGGRGAWGLATAWTLTFRKCGWNCCLDLDFKPGGNLL